MKQVICKDIGNRRSMCFSSTVHITPHYHRKFQAFWQRSKCLWGEWSTAEDEVVYQTNFLLWKMQEGLTWCRDWQAPCCINRLLSLIFYTWVTHQRQTGSALLYYLLSQRAPWCIEQSKQKVFNIWFQSILCWSINNDQRCVFLKNQTSFLLMLHKTCRQISLVMETCDFQEMKHTQHCLVPEHLLLRLFVKGYCPGTFYTQGWVIVSIDGTPGPTLWTPYQTLRSKLESLNSAICQCFIWTSWSNKVRRL